MQKLAISSNCRLDIERENTDLQNKYHSVSKKLKASERKLDKIEKEMVLNISERSRKMEEHFQKRCNETADILKNTNVFNKSKRKKQMKSSLNESMMEMKVFSSELQDLARFSEWNGHNSGGAPTEVTEDLECSIDKAK